MLMKLCRNFENVEINFSEIFEFSGENSWILQEFWPNSDLKSSNGSVPRRSNLSTKAVTAARSPAESAEEEPEAREADEGCTSDESWR